MFCDIGKKMEFQIKLFGQSTRVLVSLACCAIFLQLIVADIYGWNSVPANCQVQPCVLIQNA